MDIALPVSLHVNVDRHQLAVILRIVSLGRENIEHLLLASRVKDGDAGALGNLLEHLIAVTELIRPRDGLKITGMINNTNLQTITRPDELRDGYEVLKEVTERTGVPVLYTTGKKEMLDIFAAEGHDPKYYGELFPIDIYMKRDWESYIHSL